MAAGGGAPPERCDGDLEARSAPDVHRGHKLDLLYPFHEECKHSLGHVKTGPRHLFKILNSRRRTAAAPCTLVQMDGSSWIDHAIDGLGAKTVIKPQLLGCSPLPRSSTQPSERTHAQSPRAPSSPAADPAHHQLPHRTQSAMSQVHDAAQRVRALSVLSASSALRAHSQARGGRA